MFYAALYGECVGAVGAHRERRCGVGLRLGAPGQDPRDAVEFSFTPPHVHFSSPDSPSTSVTIRDGVMVVEPKQKVQVMEFRRKAGGGRTTVQPGAAAAIGIVGSPGSGAERRLATETVAHEIVQLTRSLNTVADPATAATVDRIQQLAQGLGDASVGRDAGGRPQAHAAVLGELQSIDTRLAEREQEFEGLCARLQVGWSVRSVGRRTQTAARSGASPHHPSPPLRHRRSRGSLPRETVRSTR